MADRQTFKPTSPTSARGDGENSSKEEDEHAVSKKYFKAWHIKKGTRQHDDDAPTDEQPLMADKLDVKEDQEEEKEESKLRIALKCVFMLIGGVALVTAFSGPMCDVLTALTNKKNKSYIPIPSFYVSFVVTPFCSNASELVSSLIFASKKTRETATMTFSQLFGAATMNNTMCLSIFMALVYFKDLEWYYGAEVVSIVFVQWVIGILSLSKTYKVWMGFPVAATYVVCLVIVYVLEYQFNWK